MKSDSGYYADDYQAAVALRSKESAELIRHICAVFKRAMGRSLRYTRTTAAFALKRKSNQQIAS